MLPVLNRAVYAQPTQPPNRTPKEVPVTTTVSTPTEVSTADLKRAMAALAPLGKGRTLPILSYTQVHLSKDTVRLRATDMEVDLYFTLPVSDGPEEEQKFIVPTSILARTAKATSAQRTRMLWEKGVFTVGAVGMEGKEEDDECGFPAEMSLHAGHPMGIASVNAPSFVTAMDRSFLFTSTDPTKPTLSSVLLDEKRIAATDGFVLSVEPVQFVNHECLTRAFLPNEDGKHDQIQAPLISRNAWKTLKAALKGAVGVLNISRDDTLVLFDRPGMACFVRPVSGNYPAYYKVIPASFEHELELPRKEILGALKEVDTLRDDYNQNVRLFLDEKGIRVVFKHPDNGTAESFVPMRGLPTLSFAFDIRYMLSVFSSNTADFLPFSYNTEVAVCKFGNVYLMPVRYADQDQKS